MGAEALYAAGSRNMEVGKQLTGADRPDARQRFEKAPDSDPADHGVFTREQVREGQSPRLQFGRQVGALLRTAAAF